MIRIEDLSYGYKLNTPIFNQISLEIGVGIYGLLGDNGVGKTTLMHLICGLLFPQGGTCTFNGEHPAYRHPELLNQFFFLPEEMQMPSGSIREFALKHSRFYPHFNPEEFEQNIDELQIDSKHKFASLSYGQQKKAMLAYAFALHTPLLMLDEPTNGLDISSRKALRKIISRSINEESCLLISTHQARDFDNLFEHLILLGKQEVLLNRSMDDISERLLFVQTDMIPEGAIYYEQSLSGYLSVLANDEKEENTPDIELLYNALQESPEQIKSLFS